MALTIDHLLQQAHALHQSGHLQESGELYLAILQTKPTHPEANYNLGMIAVQANQPAASLPYFMAALDADPARGQYWVSYIDALFQSGQLEDARQILALARQQGLEGEEVDALVQRLEGASPSAEPDNIEVQHDLDESLPDSSATPKNNNTNLKTKPTLQEINTLVALFGEGRLTEAATFAQSMTERFPLHEFGWKALGAVYLRTGRIADALVPMQKAAALSPDDVEAHYNLGAILYRVGRLGEAEASYRHVLEIKPDYAEAHNNLGGTFQALGRLDEAEASYRRALEINPHYADAHYNLGNILKDLARLDEAEASYRRVLQIRPDYADAHYNLGILLNGLGRLGEAEASYRRVLHIQPDNADAHGNLGVTLQALGRLNEAETCCRRALQIKPDDAEVHNNLGVILQQLGRLDEAETCGRRALQIKPDYAEAHNNLGATLWDMGRLDEAEACYRRALQIKPDYAKAHNNLGITLQDLGRLGEAGACFKRALQIKPDYAEAHSNLLFSLNYAPNQSPSDGFVEAHKYGQDITHKVTFQFTKWSCIKHPERLRVGFVSGDFNNHPVGYFLESLLLQLDPTAIELVAYPTNHKADELTARIKPRFSAWSPLLGLNDEAAALRIHGDGVHVLIDLSGHTRHNRLPVFAWKPAPVQVSWLGYFATTGVAEMDYLIADPWTLPEREEPYFTEKIWRLPETRLCFTPPDLDLAVSSLPAFTNGYVTFGCFNNLTKMNEEVVSLWSRVLYSVPGSRLFLKTRQLKEAAVRQHTIERFADHGIEADRLVLEGSESREKYLAAYHRVDIALDPFPFPGGTTTVEGLWMGVPVVALAGERFLSRQGSGILMNAGLAEWVAADADEYVKCAASHAEDLQRLAKLRNSLRQQVLASPLMDAKRFATYFLAALHGMYQAWSER